MPQQKGRWALLLALVTSALLWLLAWYGDTVQSMIATWLSSETFAHGFVILPICVWLVWRRRHVIRALVPRPNFWMLVPLALAGVAWLLGHLASVAVVQQYAVIVMILFLVATILGNQIVREIAFPLLFLLFAVPIGEVFLPALMEHTADFTVFALRLTGIPVYREGLYFTLPSGNWSVIEACSGLRYLIASVTLGVLYAYLTYRSLRRRAAFVALSIIVPIVANWMRAYMIVMIGHLTSMKHAAGVDHLIYGWFFFGLVMLILFWAGAFWREDRDSEAAIPDSAVKSVSIGPSLWKTILTAVLASAGVVAALPAIASHLKSGLFGQPVLQVPHESSDWRPGSGALTDWTPRFMNPSARIRQVYLGGTRRVELFIWYYRNQRHGAQLISSQNALVHTSDNIWANSGAAYRVLNTNGSEIKIIESRLRGRATRLLVWHWYWIDGQYTANAYWAKLLQAKSMLLGRGDNAAAIIVATPYDLSPAEGTDRLQDFVNNMLPAIAEVLQRAR
jgi:exosortase A